MRRGMTHLASLFALAASLVSLPVLASVSDDQVTSQKIREADGTSGQNTNSGSGVKTGHLQNDAVTTSKIANGAVTDAKITGPISASKISSTGLNADTVDGLHASAFAPTSHVHSLASISGLQASLAGKSDVTHNHDSLYQQKYGKVAVVAQTGGDYTDPVAAMNDIAAWCGAPSAANPCLVKIMPGVYTLSATLGQVNNVDIEGSGKLVTRLIGSISFGNGELRDLSIENWGNVITGGGTQSRFTNLDVALHVPNESFNYAAFWMSGSNLRFKNVSILVDGYTTGNAGIWLLHGGTASLDSVAIDSLGYGVVGWGISDYFISNSKIVAPNRGAVLDVNARISNTQLVGNLRGTIKLVNCFDADYNPIPNQ